MQDKNNNQIKKHKISNLRDKKTIKQKNGKNCQVKKTQDNKTIRQKNYRTKQPFNKIYKTENYITKISKKKN